jgi:hypothetical protein
VGRYVAHVFTTTTDVAAKEATAGQLGCYRFRDADAEQISEFAHVPSGYPLPENRC